MSTEDLLATLDPSYRSALLSMYRGEPQLGVDGRWHSIDSTTRISPSQGRYFYDLCLAVRPRSTLEIGMAFGFSTIYFLASIARNKSGYHIAVDPFQTSDWNGIGLTHANSLAPVGEHGRAFQLIEDSSDRAATDFIRSGSLFDVIFIDGNHRFDNVLVDFFLYAQTCRIGGYVIFDDMWMSSVRTVVSFVRENRRDFLETTTSEPNIAVFQKVGVDSRKWDDFHSFTVA